MIVAIVGGVGLGALFPEVSTDTALIGELFLRVLSLLIVPVIVVSMIAGVINLDDTANLGRLGLKTVGYYACTTAIAVVTGLLVVNLVQPGMHNGSELAMELPQPTEETATEVEGPGSLFQVVRNIIPTNVVKAAHDGNVLGLIFFSVFFGIALLSIPHPGTQYIKAGIGASFDAIIWMVEKIILLLPIGVLSLVASLVAGLVASGQMATLGASIGWYAWAVIVGLLIHGLVSLPILAYVFRINPLRFAGAMFPAVSTAFSTASSAASLPVTIDSLEERAGVSNKTASFVAPLGATVNMDGTAIYEAIAAVFIANMYGIELSLEAQLVIFLTATFSAVGAAGIPGAGLIMMTLVLRAVNVPVEGIALIVPVDRFLDMVRTAVNVWGDSIGAGVIASSEGENLHVQRTPVLKKQL